MRQSMTGFSSQQGQGLGLQWIWELRGVNGKGLDLRIRVPDWITGLEQQVREITAKKLDRGNVQINLRLGSDSTEGTLRLDRAHLSSVLDAMAQIEGLAMDRGLSLAPANAADIVGLRGVLTTESEDIDPIKMRDTVLNDFNLALDGFVQMRQTEGSALAQILSRQLTEIDTLRQQAADLTAARADQQQARLRAQLDKIMQNSEGLDETRIAQELALLAVKSDITEELDRLSAHVAAARDLLVLPGAVGRKLDFLMQEFNREANTLCSKSGDADLTQVGLALKTVIDQMREQVQNLE